MYYQKQHVKISVYVSTYRVYKTRKRNQIKKKYKKKYKNQNTHERKTDSCATYVINVKLF